MSERPIQIMSVNINRQSALTHALLQTSTADILIIQEPWIGTVQIGRSDSDPAGLKVPGTTNNNMWDCHLPSFTNASDVRVAAYVKTDFARTFAITNLVSHPLSTPESMILDFCFGEEILRIVNIYYRTYNNSDGHNLLHLLTSSLDPLIPTLFMGDLNMHSHIWSFPYATISPWAAELVNWFDNQGFELLNPPCEATWRSRQDGVRDSVLDLALINKAAAISGQISPLTISFSDSITSDHAALSLFWYPAEAIAITPPPELTGYAIDESRGPQPSHDFSPSHPLYSLSKNSVLPQTNYTLMSTPPVHPSFPNENTLILKVFAGGPRTAPLPSRSSTPLKENHVPRPFVSSGKPLLALSGLGHTTSYITPLVRTFGRPPPGGKVALSSGFPLSLLQHPGFRMTHP